MTVHQSRLMWGAAALAILWLMMWITQRQDIERDVAANVAADLDKAGLGWVEVNTRNRGRDVRLSGVAREADQLPVVERVALGARGVRKVDLSALEFRPWKPARVGAVIGDGAVQLTGSVSDQTIADSLVRGIGDTFGADVRHDIETDPDVAPHPGLEGLPAALAALRDVDNLEIALDGASMAVSGTAREEHHITMAASLETVLRGVDNVDVSSLRLKPWSPAAFELSPGANGPVLSGTLHSSEDSDRLKRIFQDLVSAELDARLVVDAEVAPGTWLDDMVLLVAAMAGVGSPSVVMSGGTVRVGGTVKTEAELRRIAEIAPQMTAVDVLDIGALRLAPGEPPTLSVVNADGTLLVSGRVKRQDVAGDLAAAAREAFGDAASVQIRLDPALDPAGWTDAVATLFPLVAALDEGALLVSANGAWITGIARSREMNQSVEQALADAGMAIGNRVTLAEAAPTAAGEGGPVYPGISRELLDQCESGMDSLLMENRIEFAFASAELSDSSHSLLNALVDAIGRCPEVTIEVSGHTDNVGSGEANLALSGQRAQAVRDYLVRAGVPATRLEARGFGSSQPRADNATAEGQARNRRIEFNIK